MLALGFKRKREFIEPWSFHIQICKLTLANTQGPLSVLLLALDVDQGKPAPCFKAEVRRWDQCRMRETREGHPHPFLLTPLACSLSFCFLPFYLSFKPSLSPNLDAGRTEPASLQNRRTVQINVSHPLMLTFGKITELWFCSSARDMHVSTHKLCECNKRVSSFFLLLVSGSLRAGIINILHDSTLFYTSRYICFV